MTTSGTIGSTLIPTNKLLEKSMRRAGLHPAQITPEIVDSALDSLFMLIMSLSSRGINLWCVDHQIIPLVGGKSTYVLPVGTIDILNLLHCSPIRTEYSETYNGANANAYIGDDNRISKIGVLWSEVPDASSLLQYSNDGSTWLTIRQINPDEVTADTYVWTEVDPSLATSEVRVFSTGNGVIDDIYLASGATEIMMTPFNRDDWANQPNKTFQAATQVNYYFEKLVNPQLTVWPVPLDNSRYMSLFRYRQVQDVGDLQNELELPSRWFEAVSWHLALRLAFEVPGVDPQRRQEVAAMANTFTLEAEANETDHAPVYFAPKISGYTR
jgi:hypothetical protein